MRFLFVLILCMNPLVFAQTIEEDQSGYIIEVVGEEPEAAPQQKQQDVEPVAVSSSNSNASSGKSVPTLERVDPLSWNARFGLGAAIDPSVFWLTFEAEAQVDKFLAIGPTVQFGYADTTTYTMASIGPRFTLPLSYFELYAGGGAGLGYRDQNSIRFTNFMFEMHVGAEVYIIKNFSIGGALRHNWISSQAFDGLTVLTAFFSGHF